MIHYKDDKAQRAEDVAEVFRTSGMKRPYEDVERIGRMLEHCDVLITAWDGDKMVGVARAITDYSYCCYLSDLAVDQAYQKQGIGKALVARVQQAIGEECSLVLLSSPGAVSYYPQLGFEKSERAYVVSRGR
ncbi:GNAT family N-acetyltransferase [Paenibacillus daejeonensis]|uniref:GNAT family N-acetyltransferase n=1 Tax=Paenibacillus daejeonensis TaxID=135193 RepID=UPI00037E34FE|nr:GNAT family N-acetyltransferase [Paenibacillus daejeonensis]